MKTNFEQLNKRQDLILNLIERQEKSSVAGRNTKNPSVVAILELLTEINNITFNLG